MSGPRKLSRGKRLLFITVICGMVVGLTELICLVGLNFSITAKFANRHLIAESGGVVSTESFNYPMMLHPYLGVVFLPNKAGVKQPSDQLHITEYGFIDHGSPLRKRAPGKVIVGVMGGSVARLMQSSSTAVLERELSAIPEYQGRTFDFVRLAIDGHKQPQQLMTLNYLLTLGGEFDLLINLDGLNEIALPGMDNVSKGVAAVFPRQWGEVTNLAGSEESLRNIGRLTHLRLDRRDCAAWYDTFPLRYSPTALLIWDVRNGHFERSIMELFKANVERKKQEQLPLYSSGPSEKFTSEEAELQYCADVWCRTSMMMHDLCRPRQISYFHFLQPNQYVPKSKPIGPEEAQTAIHKESPFARPVTLGYPLLQAKGAELTAHGVAFTDLTQVFASHPEPLYKDDCCHVNETGDQILAEAIGSRIRAWHASQNQN